ncbi:sugar phosphate isomerase/epimerase [Paenibacillus campi]|uniref:sugar phosphate isomerase/epimerase family protein n=1 Tax=Paenibacillus campi TaxID=3106031 RepID=UPI002AFF07E5|nr:sugar phosphate isomerase/epimerase [Paenibacillus sp. SGZ-1014]
MLKVGLQLFTVREDLERDFEGTIAKIAELGYQGVEFAGFYGRSAEQIADLLKQHNLEVVGSHTQYNDLLNDAQSLIDYNKAIGNKYIIVPYLSEEQRGNWSELFANLRKIAEVCNQNDVVLLYHNHDFELSEKIGDHTVLDALYAELPADLIQVELDTAWVQYSGYDAIEYIDKYAGRLPLVHWKDFKRTDDGIQMMELGEGEVPVARVGDAADKAGAEWIIVEQDNSLQAPLQSIEQSINWVKSYGAKGGPVNV